MNNLLPLLSGSFAEIIDKAANKYNNKIAQLIWRIHTLIDGFNSLWRMVECTESWVEVIKLAKSGVLNEIDNNINDSVRMIGIREKEFEVSFLPKGKNPEYSDIGNWSRNNRQTGKPTRIFRRLISSKEFTDTDFEEFNNLLKAILDDYGEFKIVSGKEITHWYCGDNYYTHSGSLGNSCMKHDDCQSYLELYEDHAKMLVLIKDDMLMGRAILWNIEDKIYMDRIYVCQDYLENRFIQYAEENNWYHCKTQRLLSDGDIREWVGPEDAYTSTNQYILTIPLIKQYNVYPYVDSFRYYVLKDNCITTNVDCSKPYYLLSMTDGEIEYLSDAECNECGRIVQYREDDDPDDMYWSELDECWYCIKCAVYSDYYHTYISDCKAIIHVDVNHVESFMYQEDLVEVVEINGMYYDKECDFITYDTDTNEWRLKLNNE